MHKCEVAIIGGGTPGLSLALLLARSGIDVIVVEPYPPSDTSGVSTRSSAIMKDNIELLESLDLPEPLYREQATLKTLRIFEDSDFPSAKMPTLSRSFRSNEIDQDYFAVNCPDRWLRSLLYADARKSTNITLLEGRALGALNFFDSHVEAVLEDGEIVHASLVVGADGRRSKVRDEAGISYTTKDYGRSAITAVMAHSDDHDQISTEFHRHTGPFTLVPLAEKQSTLVWMDKDDAVEQWSKASKKDVEAAIQERSRGVLGDVSLQGGIDAARIINMQANALYAPRVALMAEAAHVVSPLGAQGLNMSLRDARCLAACLVEAKETGCDLGQKSVLMKYAKGRSGDMSMRSHAIHSLQTLLGTESIVVDGMRKAGLFMMHEGNPLRKLIVKAGMAPGSKWF